jgi:beta-glucanase (GH16 family)
MYIKILFWCWALGLSLSPSPAQPKLVWSDEFATSGRPGEHWTYDLGNGCPNVCGWGNNELQYYTSEKQNVCVRDGKLVIEARKEVVDKSQYTSTRIRTAKGISWQYGYIEVRAKLPEGRGTWPAIWMLPDTLTYGGWPASGEIDIMEHVGFDQNVVHGTVHTLDFNHIKGTQVGKQKSVNAVHDTFHTYAINWTENKIEFFIDGEPYHAFENNGQGFSAWPFNQRFYLILNIAVGGGWGGMKGVDENIWPQRMEVDYVRVYEPLVSEEQRQALLNRR